MKLLMNLPGMTTPPIYKGQHASHQRHKCFKTHLGGLGSPILLYLVAFGVSWIGIVDIDFMELHNLHHWFIYSKASVGELKVKSVATTCFFLMF
jgi:molybdopterin/thiamine biosynthesis adenylyltransferase